MNRKYSIILTMKKLLIVPVILAASIATVAFASQPSQEAMYKPVQGDKQPISVETIAQPEVVEEVLVETVETPIVEGEQIFTPDLSEVTEEPTEESSPSEPIEETLVPEAPQAPTHNNRVVTGAEGSTQLQTLMAF